MRPLCAVPGCTSPPGRLPDCLVFLGMDLCQGHVVHLEEVRRAASDTLDDSSFTRLAVLREAQSLVHPNGLSALTVLEGGR